MADTREWAYRLTIEEARQHYNYPWKVEWGSIPTPCHKDVHDLLHRLDLLYEILAERERMLIDLMGSGGVECPESDQIEGRLKTTTILVAQVN
jgi:hypothetical protein